MRRTDIEYGSAGPSRRRGFGPPDSGLRRQRGLGASTDQQATTLRPPRAGSRKCRWLPVGDHRTRSQRGMNTRRRFVVVISVASLAVACSRDGGQSAVLQTASLVTSPQVPLSPGLPFAGAPKVIHPLPLSVLVGDPCTDALTPQQVATTIGVNVAGRRVDIPQLGPACAWNNHETGGAVGVSYVLNTHVGLSGVYANTQPKAALWRELPPIQGFPAVAHAGGKGDRVPAGFCQASVGLADTFSIDVNLS